MEENKPLSLEEKIQKLINNYAEIKKKYSQLLHEKQGQEEKLQSIKDTDFQKNEKIEKLEKIIEGQKEDIEILNMTNEELTQKVKSMEDNNKLALSKLDDVLNEVNEL